MIGEGSIGKVNEGEIDQERRERMMEVEDENEEDEEDIEDD